VTITAPCSLARQTETRTVHAGACLGRLLASPAVRFLVVGGACTLGYLALYALLRLVLPSQVANVLALLATGDVNTVLNRRWAFRMQGPVPRRERAKGVVAYLVSLVATSTVLALLDVVGAQGSTAELTALLVANALAGIVHYVLLRTWAFHLRPHAVGPRHETRPPTPGRSELCPAQLPVVR